MGYQFKRMPDHLFTTANAHQYSQLRRPQQLLSLDSFAASA
jgi:hypothetical protein